MQSCNVFRQATDATEHSQRTPSIPFSFHQFRPEESQRIHRTWLWTGRTKIKDAVSKYKLYANDGCQRTRLIGKRSVSTICFISFPSCFALCYTGKMKDKAWKFFPFSSLVGAQFVAWLVCILCSRIRRTEVNNNLFFVGHCPGRFLFKNDWILSSLGGLDPLVFLTWNGLLQDC